MKIIKKISLSEVVAEFLLAEYRSPRFSVDLIKSLRRLGYNEKLITEPDTKNIKDNLKRREVLRGYRKWLQFDKKKKWFRAFVTNKELGEMKYIDYNYWNELSNNTRLVRVGAENVKKGFEIFNVDNSGYWQVSNIIDKGEIIPPIICKLLTDESYELIEGHLRATAYLLAKNCPEKIEVIAGI